MIEINGKSYEFKYSLRAMFAWESIADKPFEIRTLLDTYILAYSCLISNQDNPPIEFETFIDFCDSHPETIDEFNKYLAQELKKREVMGSKKKATRKVKNSQ